MARWCCDRVAAQQLQRPGFDPKYGCSLSGSSCDLRRFSPGAPVSSHTPKTYRFVDSLAC